LSPQPRRTPIPPEHKQQQYYRQALDLLRQGNLPAAVQAAEAALAEFPQDGNLMCLAARANLAARQFETASLHAEMAVQAYPQFAAAHEVTGDVMLVEGMAAEALAAYQRARDLGAEAGLIAQKIQRAGQTLELLAAGPMPNSPTGRSMAFADEVARAERLERDGQHDEAEAIYRRILKEDPNHVEACRLLAGIACAHEEYGEARVFLQQALKLAPDYLRAMVDLCNVYRQLEEYQESVALASRLVSLVPDNAEAYMVYASSVGVAGRHEEAIAAFEKALALNPAKAGALCGIAHHQKTVGRQQEAIASYRRSLAIKPDYCESWWSLANLKTFRFEPQEVEAMQKLLQSERLPDESRSQLHNALGLEFEARGEYDTAFGHFAECNRIRRKAEFYDPVDTEDTHDRVISQFNPEYLQQAAGPALSPVPIFIVGLPRSGSTLIEQILASHSMVDGTHELSDLSKVVRAIRQGGKGRRNRLRFPETVAGFGQQDWHRIGRQYLDRSAKHRGRAPYFIDKNPNNFVFAGLLKLAIPNARIINARRHPLDSCLGSFKQLFASGQPFSYDPVELAEYYLQYQRLMDHWHEVLPGFVLDVHYEEVVQDLEAQVRRILDFCGLPFEDSCLRFHQTRRAVKTASSEQVRKPIYSSSVHLWRRYEPHLAGMVEVLEPLLTRLPEEDQPGRDLAAKTAG
jgi:tetratricopeptide (TPR) repeat protein